VIQGDALEAKLTEDFILKPVGEISQEGLLAAVLG
jgi:hypothetical protein